MSEAGKRAHDQVGVRGRLQHPGCKYVPWKEKVICEDGISPDVVEDIVAHRHVVPRVSTRPRSPSPPQGEAVEAAIAKATARIMQQAAANQTASRPQRAVVLMAGLVTCDLLVLPLRPTLSGAPMRCGSCSGGT